MPEYIEREALLKDILESVVFTVRGDSPSLEIRGANKVTDRIKSAPAADVVEVVRCKECMWWYPREYGSVIGRCENPYNGLATEYIEEDDFCSYGKRKEGAEE